MKSVTFIFGENATDENQNQVRSEVLGLPRVRNVGRVSPTATKPALRRMWCAEVDDDAAAANVVKELRQRNENSIRRRAGGPLSQRESRSLTTQPH
jgi:hypothetical protein